MYMVIEKQLDTMHSDEGPWKSYELYAEGNNLDQLMETAIISEIDQDGDDLRHYSIGNASWEVFKEAEQIILEHCNKEFNERLVEKL